MLITRHAKNMNNDSDVLVTFETEKKCPICKASISPIFFHAVMCKPHEGEPDFSVLNYCTNCDHTFLSNYKIISKNGVNVDQSKLISSVPNIFFKKIFDEQLTNLSPRFDKIYNQALEAESMDLDEIAGIGYRKALEFLVKDYAIRKNPDNEEKIKSMFLSNCINDYIDEPHIKNLAKSSAWLGNDETHYVKKFEDRDINDMKKFIKATVYFIGMVLVSDDAAAMEPK